MNKARKDWRAACLGSDASVQQAIRNLDASALQIALVVTGDGTLAGTVTDGDIRRALLSGAVLDTGVTSIMNRNPVVVPPEINKESVLQLMQINGFNAIPVVDGNRRLVDLHVLNELLAPGVRPNMMVIMAGGQGTRLRPYTENCPKPLLPVSGKPMLEHIILRAKSEGFRTFRLAIHYLGHMIEDYFGDGGRWDVDIGYIRETTPLGTAGALGLLSPRPNMTFVVTNGDVLTDIRYGELLDFHTRHSAMATMAVRQHEWQHPFGVVQTNGVDIVGFEEKPIAKSYINAGIYALDPEAFGVMEVNQHCDMPTLFSRLQDAKQRTIVYPMHEPWMDVGRIDDLEKANSLNGKGGKRNEQR